MLDDQPAIHPDSLKQFVFDNADFNVRTLDGYGTFHSMGGIMCIAPTDAVEKAAVTKRIEKVPSAESATKVHKVKLQTYIASDNTSGVRGKTMQGISSLECIRSPNIVNIAKQDTLWMYDSWLKLKSNPNWSGYMGTVTNNSGDYETCSQLVLMQFILL